MVEREEGQVAVEEKEWSLIWKMPWLLILGGINGKKEHAEHTIYKGF